MGVVGCRQWEQERKRVVEEIEKKEEGDGWGLMEKATGQMDKGLDMLKWGLEIQKKKQ